MESQQIQILNPANVVSINFEAGRLKYFIKNWEKITSDKNILDIAQKCPIEFEDGILPIQDPSSVRKVIANDNHSKIIDTEIQKLLNINVIKQVESVEGEFISTIFLRLKKNNEYRMILNLKSLNEFVEYHHFKMDTFELALNLVKPNSFMASVDLRHAYYSVPIDEQYQKFLRFIWRDTIYQYTCLPNGLASAPRLFTKLMKVVYASLRRLGHANIGYIDDSLLLGDSFEECQSNINDTVKLVSDLGFIVHKDKSILVPTKKLQFLGFVIDSENMTVSLTPEKKDKLYEECMKMLSKHTVKIREVARLLGLLISSFSGVEFGKLFYRDTEMEKTQALKLAKGNFDANMELTDKMIVEIKWWSKNIYTQFRVLNRCNPEIVIQTDASLSGWGAVLNKEKTGGRWTPKEMKHHINYLELLAILYALKSFELHLKNFTHIKILSDNTTAVSYINNMGGVKSLACNSLAKSIWFWAKLRKIWLTASHIPGKQNAADFESRNFNDQVEWQLNKEVFDRICCLWEMPQIDLFASRLNKQLDKFCSWKPDPEACFIDAFSIDWSDFKCYLFPPFSLIGKCLKKLQMEQTTAILVAPLWPTQPWFIQAMNMLIDTPILILARDNLLTLPYKETVHPLAKTLNLMVCHISENVLLKREFLKKLPPSCCALGAVELKNSTKYLLKSGFSTAVKGKLVKFKLL